MNAPKAAKLLSVYFDPQGNQAYKNIMAMRKKITIKQLEYLEHYLPDQLTGHIKKYIYLREDLILLDVDDQMLDKIRDWAGERLQQVGFDSKYNLTEEGQLLEDLIDLFI